jgi:hypothetical protein
MQWKGTVVLFCLKIGTSSHEHENARLDTIKCGISRVADKFSFSVNYHATRLHIYRLLPQTLDNYVSRSKTRGILPIEIM